LYIPPKELVDAYLGEIAKSYGVPYESAQPIEAMEDAKKGDDEDGPGEGQEKEEAKVLEIVSADDKKNETAKGKKDEATSGLPELPSTTVEAPPKKVNEDDELAKRFERLKNLK
jgi:vacuolar protein sorting-associated protein IST1